MTNRLLLSLLIFITVQLYAFQIKAQVTPGYIYEDATILYNAIKTKSNGDKVRSILYYYTNTSIADSAAFTNALTNSTFLLGNYWSRLTAVMDSDAGSSPQGVGSNLAGLNVTNYADGIAKFLIQRGRQELSVVFFNRLKNDLNKYPELKYLLPNTTIILNSLENHNLFTVLQELKDAFMKDLVKTPQNLLSLKEITSSECNGDADCQARINEIVKLFESNYLPIVLSLNLMQGMIDGNNVASALNKVVSDKKICNQNDDITGTIKLTSILLNSFMKNDREGLFLNESELKTLFSDNDLLNIFFGLVYLKYSNSECYKNIIIKGSDLKKIILTIITAKNNFYDGLSSMDNINVSYSAIKKQMGAGNPVDKSYYASLVVSSFSIINKISILSSEVLGINPSDQSKRISDNIAIGAEFCVDIQQRNYAGIYNDLVKFIDKNEIFVDEKVNQKVLKYLSFAANMASAESSDEVKEALNSASLPPGSYSIKQKSGWNVSFNAYIGYNWDIKVNYEDLVAKGIYAPLGIAVSKGMSKKCGGALTLFGSIIDVGAIATYRITGNMTDTLKQEIRLESIFAPGIQLFYVVPKTPLALGFGWRATPKLFYSNDSEFVTIPSKDVFTLSILIDIPIFNMYNVPYKF